MVKFEDFSADEIKRTSEILTQSSLVQCSPLIYSQTLSEGLNRRIFLKLESLQSSGSFKIRPATGSILMNLKSAMAKGVVTSSSGNFAQAVAYASRHWGIKCTIVMLKDSSPFKIRRVRDWGGRVLFCDRYEERDEMVKELAKQSGCLVLHPHSSRETILSDASVGYELFHQLQHKARVLVPMSGGGLASGITVAFENLSVKHSQPLHEVLAVQPKANGSYSLSLAAGEPTSVNKVNTVADALIATKPGSGFHLLKRAKVSSLDVTEEAIIEASHLLETQTGLRVEPGGAVGLAALLEHPHAFSFHETLVLLITGSNKAS